MRIKFSEIPPKIMNKYNLQKIQHGSISRSEKECPDCNKQEKLHTINSKNISKSTDMLPQTKLQPFEDTKHNR